MWWIIGSVIAGIVVIAVVVVAVMSSGSGGDTVTCPHCNRRTPEPRRRRTGADIDLYDFRCKKCGKTIYVKAGGR